MNNHKRFTLSETLQLASIIAGVEIVAIGVMVNNGQFGMISLIGATMLGFTLAFVVVNFLVQGNRKPITTDGELYAAWGLNVVGTLFMWFFALAGMSGVMMLSNREVSFPSYLALCSLATFAIAFAKPLTNYNKHRID